jgi:hypothetical protein
MSSKGTSIPGFYGLLSNVFIATLRMLFKLSLIRNRSHLYRHLPLPNEQSYLSEQNRRPLDSHPTPAKSPRNHWPYLLQLKRSARMPDDCYKKRVILSQNRSMPLVVSLAKHSRKPKASLRIYAKTSNSTIGSRNHIGRIQRW